MNWIKVAVKPQAVFAGAVFPMGFRIFCRHCGHDDFRSDHAEAMERARQMRRDHIPFSPDGSLSCYQWAPVEVGEECFCG